MQSKRGRRFHLAGSGRSALTRPEPCDGRFKSREIPGESQEIQIQSREIQAGLNLARLDPRETQVGSNETQKVSREAQVKSRVIVSISGVIRRESQERILKLHQMIN